ncbi:hypothetical protein [Methanocorpusculum vombati]|uniref:Uncharacterized protein n=1 Tax=Methanocorpusculum vombati TaxID=3002864 RepID=A0ABT4IPV1_9EURY|nr:hypothetical protein [Methanocorpusculum vombati]MCZ9319763.1 hypothetical protein [Methanocorpusculum sp.]MCZ0863148.1 hypothetical protein [Methanocorpusculum vombati]MDE2520255.1 hypothetical protein [Methanocorpusculum sp.]MDE2533849.1 hypothetical protein [Methanocorpusculum sp.]MDE2545893.1 hypothetical protein [Methanocorpusculum sp.]
MVFLMYYSRSIYNKLVVEYVCELKKKTTDGDAEKEYLRCLEERTAAEQRGLKRFLSLVFLGGTTERMPSTCVPWFPKAKPKIKTPENGNHFSRKRNSCAKNRNVADIWHTICGSDVICPLLIF